MPAGVPASRSLCCHTDPPVHPTSVVVGAAATSIDAVATAGSIAAAAAGTGASDATNGTSDSSWGGDGGGRVVAGGGRVVTAEPAAALDGEPAPSRPLRRRSPPGPPPRPAPARVRPRRNAALPIQHAARRLTVHQHPSPVTTTPITRRIEPIGNTSAMNRRVCLVAVSLVLVGACSSSDGTTDASTRVERGARCIVGTGGHGGSHHRGARHGTWLRTHHRRTDRNPHQRSAHHHGRSDDLRGHDRRAARHRTPDRAGPHGRRGRVPRQHPVRLRREREGRGRHARPEHQHLERRRADRAARRHGRPQHRTAPAPWPT